MKRESVAALAGFLPNLQRPDFKAGAWVEPPVRDDGVFVMPYVELSKTAHDFVQMAYENGWVRSDFHWMEWAQTDEAKQMRERENALASATADQLAQLLTMSIRMDRFCEGSLKADFESGLILRIVLRAKALLDEVETR
jgi:hypothetical protein